MSESDFQLGTEIVESGNLILDRDGAEPFILFGCTVRSISTTLGLSDNASSITVTVVQEEGQLFDFKKGTAISKGLEDITELTFGKFHLHGIIESWQETIVSIQGSGIFEVKLKGPTDFSNLIQINRNQVDLGLDQNALFDLKVGRPPGFTSLINPGFFFEGEEPIFENVIDLSTSVVRDFGINGLRFDTIIDAIEREVLTFNMQSYKINMQQLKDLIESRNGNSGDQDAAYRLPFTGSTLSEILDSIATDLTFQWWISVGDIETIEIPEVITEFKGNITIEPAHTITFTVLNIEILDMTLDSVPGELSVEALKNLHSGHVIIQTNGFDGTHMGFSSLILKGPERRTLIEHDGVEFKQFWGWEQDSFKAVPLPDEPIFPDKIGLNAQEQEGVTPPLFIIPEPIVQPILDDTSDIFRTAFDPLDSPAFHLPGTPDGERFETTIEEMKLAINGQLEDVLSEEKLAALIAYAKQFWGRVFYLSIPEEDWDNSNFGTWTTPRIVGWWESNVLEHIYPGTFDQDPNTERAKFLLDHFANEDGRWDNFCRIPSLDFTLNQVQWQFPAQQGGFSFSRFGKQFAPTEEIYVPFKVVQRGHFILIVLDVALRFRTGDPFSDEGTTLDFFSELNNAKIWLAESDKRIIYGPWSTEPMGTTKIINDNSLVPWAEGFRGITNEEGFTNLNNIALARINRFRPTRTLAETGTLEVAGLPEANLGQKIGFSIIQKINISFGINGIKTRYDFGRIDQGINRLFFKQQEEKRRKDRDEIENFSTEIEQKEIVLSELETGFEVDIIPDIAIPEEFEGLIEDVLDIIIDKPEGGKGRIVRRSLQGPFYDITRLNARQLKEGFGSLIDLSFITEWTGVRNLGEKDNSPGLLPIGQIVNVSIYQDTIGGAEAFIEVTPPNFAPPIPQQ